MSKKPISQQQRRQFLGLGIAAGAGALIQPPVHAQSNHPALKVEPWSQTLGSGVATTPYGQPSQFESKVVRRYLPWMSATRESSASFTPLQNLFGIITPSGLHFERHHAGTPTIDPAQHALVIHGMVKQALKFSLNDLLRYPSITRIHFVECAGNGALEQHGAQLQGVQFTHGMLSCSEWTGVPLKTLLQEAGVKSGAKWLLAEGADAAALARSFPLQKALDDALIVYAQNGEMLRPEQGYPLRLLLPGFEGVANIKWLRRIEVGDKPWEMREETATYTDLLPSRKARQYTFIQEAKSVITYPCPEKPMQGNGRYCIQGFAWSGEGKVKRVDVSIDGGRNWHKARLNGPVLDKSLTRFEFDWDWSGQSALLQSRTTDETGYVQPNYQQLRAIRGENSMYHNNAIQTWLVKPSGEVENVQLD